MKLRSVKGVEKEDKKKEEGWACDSDQVRAKRWFYSLPRGQPQGVASEGLSPAFPGTPSECTVSKSEHLRHQGKLLAPTPN